MNLSSGQHDVERDLIASMQRMGQMLSTNSQLVQRDLEDQIVEEKKLKSNTMDNQDVLKIKPSEVINLLKQGYTRLKKDNKGQGSIQEKYGLSAYQVVQLFKDSRLKGRKTIAQKSPGFILTDEEETTVEGRLENEAVEAGGIKDRGDITDVKVNEKDELFV